MSEENTTAATDQQPQQPPLVVNGQYVKDLSFEVPGAPGIFGSMHKHKPDIAMHVDVAAKTLRENTFEVVLHIRAECKVGEETGFIAELAYAGMFTVTVPREHLEPVLLIECPKMLFPFARNIIADVTRDGGFPPVMLGLIDFVSMYQNRMAERQKQAEAAPQGNA